MITVPDVVFKIVKETPYIEEALGRNLINLSSLARMIRERVEKETKKSVKLGAIIVALTRLQQSIDKTTTSQPVLKGLGDLTVRSNLIEWTFANRESLIDKQRKLIHSIGNDKAIFCNISTSIHETTIIASRGIATIIEQTFSDEKLISKFESICSITIRLPMETVRVPGVYYHVLKYLAWENINLVEVFSTYTELTLFFLEKDIDRAFSILNTLHK